MITHTNSGNTTKCLYHKKQSIEAVCLYPKCQQPVLSCFNCRLKHQDHPESYIHIDNFLNSVDEQFNVAQLQRQFEHKCANLRSLKDELRQKFTVQIQQVMQKAEIMLQKFNEQVDCNIDTLSNSYNPCLQFIQTLKNINAQGFKLEETTFSKARQIFTIQNQVEQKEQEEENGERLIILNFLPQKQIDIPFEAAKESSLLISTRVTKYLAEFDCLLNSLVNLTSVLKEKSNRGSNLQNQLSPQESPAKHSRSSCKQQQNSIGCLNQRKTPSFSMNQISENSHDSNSNTVQNCTQTKGIVSQLKDSPRKQSASQNSYLLNTIDVNSLQRDYQNQCYQLREHAVPHNKVVQINQFSEPSLCMQDSLRHMPSPGESKRLSGSGKMGVSETKRNSSQGKQLNLVDSSSFQIIEENSISLRNKEDNKKDRNIEKNSRPGENQEYQSINSRSSHGKQEKIKNIYEKDSKSSGTELNIQEMNSEKKKMKDQQSSQQGDLSQKRDVQKSNGFDKIQQNSLNTAQQLFNNSSNRKSNNNSHKSSNQSSESNQAHSRYSIVGSHESV